MPQNAPRRLNLVYHFIEVTFDQNEEENSFGFLYTVKLIAIINLHFCSLPGIDRSIAVWKLYCT